MDQAAQLAIYGGLFVTGLASSLHCIGMCGPILIGFSQAFEQVPLTVNRQRRVWPLAWDFLWYHTGRIWTYAALGFVVGLLGQALHHGWAWVGWQRAAGLTISVIVILSGVALLGVIPGVKLDALLNDCGIKKTKRAAWFRCLVQGRGATPRLLLGAIMGLLPCGLVYAVLAIVASLPTPWHSALGMVIFGLGTLPSLTTVLVANRLISVKLRAYGTRLAAIMVIASGLWMVARHFHHHDHDAHAGHAVPKESRLDAPASQGVSMGAI